MEDYFGLTPCKFCGGKEEEDLLSVVEHADFEEYWVECECKAQGPHAATFRGAILMWNSNIGLMRTSASEE